MTYEELERKWHDSNQHIARLNALVFSLSEEKERLAKWKEEALTVDAWWQKIDTLVREKDWGSCAQQQVSDIAWNRLCDYYELRSAFITLKKYI